MGSWLSDPFHKGIFANTVPGKLVGCRHPRLVWSGQHTSLIDARLRHPRRALAL